MHIVMMVGRRYVVGMSNAAYETPVLFSSMAGYDFTPYWLSRRDPFVSPIHRASMGSFKRISCEASDLRGKE